MDEYKKNYEGFKQSAKEYLDALPKATSQESIENGFKCLTLIYLNMIGSQMELDSAAIVLKVVGRKMMEKELELILVDKNKQNQE